MKSKENVTVYACDFCNKKMFVKKAMERHEQWCAKNPDNFKKCAGGCIHLEEVKVDYEVDVYGGDTMTKKANGFRCNKLGKMLYPLIVEKKRLPEKWPETFFDQEPMPKECEHYQYFQ